MYEITMWASSSDVRDNKCVQSFGRETSCRTEKE
jgi:hypothetical protein